MLKGNQFTTQDAGKDFVSSYKDRYFIMDNLDEKGIPSLTHREEIFNTMYSYITIVVRGALHLRINGLDVEIKANELIHITPCMSVEVMDSNCIYYCSLTISHIINDIHDSCGIGQHIKYRSFYFTHYSFDKNIAEDLLSQYKRLKREHLRPDYSMKEASIRALTAAYALKFHSFRPQLTVIKHFDDNSRQQQFFVRFLEFLSLYCKQERSVQFYADKLHITPKYLSNITNIFTRLSSSVVIDHYVIYHIQETLFVNEFNIKKVSEMYHFPSQSFFGRYFKRITGMSPNAFVKLINKE